MSLVHFLLSWCKDHFEHHQVNLAHECLNTFYPLVMMEQIAGVHLSTAEKARDMADMILLLASKPSALYSDKRVRPAKAESRVHPVWVSAD